MLELMNEAEFEQVLNKNDFLFIDFFSTSCSSCKMLEKTLEQLKEKYINVSFCKANIENLEKIAIQYEMTVMPCCLLFVGQRLKNRIDGFKTKSFYEEILDSI